MTDARKLLKQNDEKGIWFWSSTLLFFHRVLNLWSCTEDLIFFRVLSHTCPMYWIFTPMFFQTVVCTLILCPNDEKGDFAPSHVPVFFHTTDVSLLCSRVVSHVFFHTTRILSCSAPVLDLLYVFFHTSSTACIESLAEQEVQPSIRWFYSFIPHNSSYLVCFDPRPIE